MRTIINVSLVLTLLSGGGAAAQFSQAAIDLAAAIRTETIDGDLEAAIQQYATIAETSDRAIAAEALIRMGGAYEKLGKPEALEVYQQVLREYADEAEPVAAARTRLAALEVEPTPASPTLHTELLWAEARGVYPGGSVSPDGTLVTYVDWSDNGNLAVRNLATGENRRLTTTADNGDYFANDSRISPDGDQVVYSWADEVRLLPLVGDQTEPRTVWSPADGSWPGVQDWFPSGDRVVAVVNNSIVTVSTVDGQVQPIRSIDWGPSPQVRVSRDGRYLAYSRSASREVPELDIFIVAVDGSSETVLVQHDANDELVAWSQDGTHLLFNSDRSGQPGLWAQRVQNAEPSGEPTLLIANLDVGAGLGITRDGSLHYSVRVSRRRLKIAELDISTGRLLAQPVNVTDRFVGGNNGGVFSPDGEMLAYSSARQGWGQTAFVIRSLRTGEERDISPDLQRFGLPVWRPDSERLLVRGQDDRGRNGYVDVNVASGQTRPLPATIDVGPATLTPDGTQILHRKRYESPQSLFSYNVADSTVHAIPGLFGNPWWGGHFSLSPDGQWIATIVGQRDKTDNYGNELRLQAAAGGDGDALWTTDDGELGRWTSWTPDGTALLVPKRDPQAGPDMWRVWIVPVDGADPVGTELVYEPANAGAIAFDIHPDGTRIVYTEGGYFQQFWALHNLGLD